MITAVIWVDAQRLAGFWLQPGYDHPPFGADKRGESMDQPTDRMKRMVLKDCWTCLFTFAPEADTLPASPATVSYKM